MTNEDVQDPLNEVGVHFCLVSKQAAVNLLPVEHYRPNAVVLFVSHEMQAQARDLQAAMLKSLPGLRINIISLADAWDPKSRSKRSRYSSENDVLIEKSVKYTDFFLLSIVYV